MTLIDASSGYHNINIDKKSFYPAKCACQSGMYTFTTLYLKWHYKMTCSSEIDQIFKDLPNVFGIACDIIIIGYDATGRDHDKSLKSVMQIGWRKNLKLT